MRPPTGGYVRGVNTLNAQGESVKLLFFDDWKLGVLKGNNVVDVSAAVSSIPHTGPHDLLIGLIARFGEYKARVEDAAGKGQGVPVGQVRVRDRKSTRLNSSHLGISYAVFCLKKKKTTET